MDVLVRTAAALYLIVAYLLLHAIVCRWLGFSEEQLGIMLGYQPKPDYKLIAKLERELFGGGPA